MMRNSPEGPALSVAHEPAEIIVDNTGFLPVCLKDMMNAKPTEKSASTS
jgi:hypothetical protein